MTSIQASRRAHRLSRRPELTVARATVVSVSIAVVGVASLSCGAPDSLVSQWTELVDSSAFRVLSESARLCDQCLRLEHLVRVGDVDGPGYLTDVEEGFVRDSAGNYWIGQRGEIKVFDSSGRFVRVIGRPGNGPMEFQYAQPIYTDAQGRVHVLDVGNSRETIIDQNFSLVEERGLPGPIGRAEPLSDGDRHVAHMLLRTAQGIGLPLHIFDGPEVIHSFGAPTVSEPQNAYTLRRTPTTDRVGHLFSVKEIDYEIEVWTSEGRRITGFRGPQLYDREPRQGAWTPDNPPASRVMDIHADAIDQLWLGIRRRKEAWQDAAVEVVAPDGLVMLAPASGLMTDFFQSFIEVIDLNSASIVIRVPHDGNFARFLDDGSFVTVTYTEIGVPQYVVSSPHIVR